MISQLKTLNLPLQLCKFISGLFYKRFLHFISPFGSKCMLTAYRGLLRDNVFSSILFNLYMNQIFYKHTFPAINIFVYVDNIIIYISHKSLDLSIELLNNALANVSVALNDMCFKVALNKGKFMVFTKRRITVMYISLLETQIS